MNPILRTHVSESMKLQRLVACSIDRGVSPHKDPKFWSLHEANKNRSALLKEMNLGIQAIREAETAVGLFTEFSAYYES